MAEKIRRTMMGGSRSVSLIAALYQAQIRGVRRWRISIMLCGTISYPKLSIKASCNML
jgi:hypothetical protein